MMGFESKVFGFIAVNSGGSKLVSENILKIERSINSLPLLKDDNFPFLPREMFDISRLENAENNAKISYRSIMIHFGISMKQLDDKLDEWISKYEKFLSGIEDAKESIVKIEMAPYTADYPMSHLSYHWVKDFSPKSDDFFWKFEGDPISWSKLIENNFQPQPWKIRYV